MGWGTGWPQVVAWLAVLTMMIANLVAGRQESVKRMLAYSSIAHAGYVLVGVVAIMRSEHGTSSVLFYLLTYTVSTVGAFGALILCGRRGAEAVSYEDLAGLGKRHPAVALAFSFFLLSLAGVPPTAGFFGKLYVFSAAIDAELYVLAVIGLLEQRAGRLLLPARDGLHVHARAGAGRAHRHADALGLRGRGANRRGGVRARVRHSAELVLGYRGGGWSHTRLMAHRTFLGGFGLLAASLLALAGCKGKPKPDPVAVGSVSLPAPIASSLPIDPKIVSAAVNAKGEAPYTGATGTISGVVTVTGDPAPDMPEVIG